MNISVGRIVYYHHNRHAGPQLAAVAKVHSDTCVNVALWSEDGCPVHNPPTSIRFLKAGEALPTSGAYCVFPPREE